MQAEGEGQQSAFPISAASPALLHTSDASAIALAALAAFSSHNSSDHINDSPLAPTVLGDDGVYGKDLFEASNDERTYDHAPSLRAPREYISPDCLSSIQEKITEAVEMKQVVLLHQKPGFGKTRTIFKLLSAGYFCMIFVPTNPLKDQVRLKFDCEFVCAVLIERLNPVYAGDQKYTRAWIRLRIRSRHIA